METESAVPAPGVESGRHEAEDKPLRAPEGVSQFNIILHVFKDTGSYATVPAFRLGSMRSVEYKDVIHEVPPQQAGGEQDVVDLE